MSVNFFTLNAEFLHKKTALADKWKKIPMYPRHAADATSCYRTIYQKYVILTILIPLGVPQNQHQNEAGRGTFLGVTFTILK